MEEVARAKVNLALHVRGREPDGYHRLETIFAFCEHGDVLSVREGEGLSLALTGPFASALSPADDNLVLRAARCLTDRSPVEAGAALLLDKRLPVASGIGGGSADAAAALRLLNRWWEIGATEGDLLAIARTLGADVPACLLSRTARGEGRGDRLDPIDVPGVAATPILLVNPGVAVSTAAVFRLWDERDGGPLPEDFRAARNDLEEPARRLAPQIREVLEALSSCEGATLVRMSGSGATCFGLFEDRQRRDAAAARIGADHPHWWQLCSRLV
jgi:4-diphosphocytidyl-2-C-methyl-D-erythritol kinase